MTLYPQWLKNPSQSRFDTEAIASPTALDKVSNVLAAIVLSVHFTFDHIFSIGFMSGEYGGRYLREQPADSIASCTPDTLCEPRLSMMTISPGRNAGTRHCSTQATKARPSIGPSRIMGANGPSRRTAETNVHVSQCPTGAEPERRCPVEHLPYKRAKDVDAALSSIKTSLLAGMASNSLTQVMRCSWTS